LKHLKGYVLIHINSVAVYTECISNHFPPTIMPMDGFYTLTQAKGTGSKLGIRGTTASVIHILREGKM
jgi:hypothetical protein